MLSLACYWAALSGPLMKPTTTETLTGSTRDRKLAQDYTLVLRVPEPGEGCIALCGALTRVLGHDIRRLAGERHGRPAGFHGFHDSEEELLLDCGERVLVGGQDIGGDLEVERGRAEPHEAGA